MNPAQIGHSYLELVAWIRNKCLYLQNNSNYGKNYLYQEATHNTENFHFWSRWIAPKFTKILKLAIKSLIIWNRITFVLFPNTRQVPWGVPSDFPVKLKTSGLTLTYRISAPLRVQQCKYNIGQKYNKKYWYNICIVSTYVVFEWIETWKRYFWGRMNLHKFIFHKAMWTDFNCQSKCARMNFQSAPAPNKEG